MTTEYDYIQFADSLGKAKNYDIFTKRKQMKRHKGSEFRGMVFYHLAHIYQLEDRQIAKLFEVSDRLVYYWVRKIEDLLEIEDEEIRKLYLKLKP